MTAARNPRLLRLADRQNWKCYYCPRQMDRAAGLGTSATTDHKLPLCRGGTGDRLNLVACCWRCNNVKGSMTAAEFFTAWGDMSRLPDRAPAVVARRRDYPTKERQHLVASVTPAGKSSKRLPKPPANSKPCGLASLGDIADLRRVLPLHVRLDMAWAAFWEHCLAVVDERREREKAA